MDLLDSDDSSGRKAERTTFLDYIQNGTEFSFIVAVDFTASNENPSDSNSLHCKDPTGAPSQYITAIKSVGDSSNFFVLLIITKGVITDLKATRSAIAQASCLPMSSIIIGVGSKDFSFMNLLDSDDSSGRKAEGDIVQFVKLQRFIRRQGTRTTWNKELLTKKVPEELPDQLVDYMKSKRTKASGSQETPYTLHNFTVVSVFIYSCFITLYFIIL